MYDGGMNVERGVITVPVNKPHWVEGVWLRGYEVDPDTGKRLSLVEVKKRAESIREGTDSRRQPAR